jgi:ATP-dependent protease ClpP protease subunit
MVHDGYETRVDDIPRTFQNWAEYSKKSQQIMYHIFAERSRRPASFWRKKCAADLILTAQEAKELGLVDSIYGEP